MTNGHRHRFWTDEHPFYEERRRARDPKPRLHPILRFLAFVVGMAAVLACLWIFLALLSIIAEG